MVKRAKINIAIDGPSGSGKGTTSKNLAKKLGFNYLDTGSMYRAIAFYFHQNNIDATSLQNFDKILNSIKLDFNSENHIMLNKIDIENLIRTPIMGTLASDISKLGPIRDFLAKKQKKIVEKGGYIAEGRDIGSVIMPNAELKIYLTASVDARSLRRLLEFQEKGIEITLEEVKKQIIERDKQDMQRKLAPLVKLPDAIEVDTSKTTIESQVEIIYEKAIEILNKNNLNYNPKYLKSNNENNPNHNNTKHLIGIKTSLKEKAINEKIFEGLELLEIFLRGSDFEEENYIENQIKKILKKYPKLKITLHCPVISEESGVHYSLALIDDNHYKYVKKMYELCKNNSKIIGFIMHPENGKKLISDEKIFEKNLKKIREDFAGIDDLMYVENLVGDFTVTKDKLLPFLKKFKIKCVCFDFAHFSAYNNEKDFYETLEYLNTNYKLYCHISDNVFNCQDSFPKNFNSGGKIDFTKAIKSFNLGIIETYSKDENIGVEIKKDYYILKEIIENNS